MEIKRINQIKLPDKRFYEILLPTIFTSDTLPLSVAAIKSENEISEVDLWSEVPWKRLNNAIRSKPTIIQRIMFLLKFFISYN